MFSVWSERVVERWQGERFSDEVKEGRSSVRVDEDRVERGGWMVNN